VFPTYPHPSSEEEAALLAAVAAEPGNDLPRLLYADWLDERTEPQHIARAEFIRLQIAMEFELKAGTEAHARCKLLYQRFHKFWLGDITKLLAAGFWLFRRGFPHGLTIHNNRLYRVLPIAARMKAAWPTLCSVKAPAAANMMLTIRLLLTKGDFTELDISEMCACQGCAIDAELQDYFRTPEVLRLTALNMAGNRLHAHTLLDLLQDDRPLNLVSLNISANRPTQTCLLGLLGANQPVRLPKLKRFISRDNFVGARVVRQLVRTAWYPQLELLDLSRNSLTDEAAKHLLHAQVPPSLRLLELRGNRFTPAMVQSLIAAFGQKVRV